MKLLFVTATRIGDAVLSTGLLDHLLRRHPGAAVTVAAGAPAAPLFEAVPGLARLIPIVKGQSRLGHWLDLYRRVAGTRWDLAVDLRGSALAYLLWARQRRVIGKGDPALHRVEQLATLFDLPTPPAPRLWTSPAHEAAAAALVPLGGPVLAVGPAANWRGKTWRAERFAELAQRLTAPGGPLPNARVAVLAAAHERPQAEPLLAAVPPARRLDLVGRADLLTAAAVLRRAALFVGNDTGIMHVAAAMGTPTLGLFGPSRPEHYRPWGPHAAIVTTATPYDELIGAPGYDYRTTDTLMDSLTVDAVMDAARCLAARFPGEAA
jgi:ADP-heptose:LPS heptosyltransferase